jgi:lantibiotic modifying enzyme
VLYDPAQFEPIGDEAWEEARVGSAIREIVADADAAFDPEGLWPAHEWDGWQAALPMKNLYVGAAGVVWALDELRQRGYAESTIDLSAAALRALDAWRAEPDYMASEAPPSTPESGLLTGEAGILLVANRLAPREDLADALLARVRSNLASEAEDLMWGTPGTLLAAACMRDRTGEERWADAARESADALAARRDAEGLWTQHLWGQEFRSLGVVHGVVGNVRALLRVDDPRNDSLVRETADLLAERAGREGGRANWSRERKLQWCDGASGIVEAAADYLDEDLLLAGAELVWSAGAHRDEKGYGLCHGTSGNGWALLKTFARTGDERWLERARRFAVHALAQAERLRAERGRRRYSLWTGDVGTALFAASCLEAKASYPLLDGP